MVLGFVSYPVVEVEPKYKKLADAIRDGCKEHPRQAFGYLFKDEPDSFFTSACALGAAVSVGYDVDTLPKLLGFRIMFKNDWRMWSRERIADWLETL